MSITEQRRSQSISAPFSPAPSPHGDGGPATLHGLTHREVTLVIFPDDPEKHSTIDNRRLIDVSGPSGSLHGYVEVSAFKAVCAALGVLEMRS